VMRKQTRLCAKAREAKLILMGNPQLPPEKQVRIR